MKTNITLKNKINKIKVLVMDVDGVLTTGKIIYDFHGEEIKIFDVKDGFGITMLKRAGLKTAIISARSAPAVTKRVTDLKVDKMYQDAYPKLGAYESLLKDLNVKDDEVCFIGDDWPDIVILERVGFSVAVKNAVIEVKKVSDYVTKSNGGEGAVRELVELILKMQNKWKEVYNLVCKKKLKKYY